jgi:hypothetical protein
MEDVDSNEFLILDLNPPNCRSSVMVTVKNYTVGQNGVSSLWEVAEICSFAQFVTKGLGHAYLTH